MKDKIIKIWKAIVDDLKANYKIAKQEKLCIMPFTAPIYLVWWHYKYIAILLDDFIEFFKIKTREEREIFDDKKTDEFEYIRAKKQYAYYSLLATLFYWFLIGFDLKHDNIIQVINVPTYFYLMFFTGMVDYFQHIPGIPLDQLHMLGHMNIQP